MTTAPTKLIEELKQLLLDKNIPVSDLDMTTGNYDEDKRLIPKPLPTITTELCEIGAYDGICYFNVILEPEHFSQKLFDSIKPYDIRIYGLHNFTEDLYPRPNFSYVKLEAAIANEKYIQVQFNFPVALSVEDILVRYLEVSALFMGTIVVNQLSEVTAMTDRRIGLDMDGVIIDHTKTIINRAEELGVKLQPEQTAIVALKNVLSDTDLEKIYGFIYESPRAADTSILMPGVEAALQRIVASGAKIYILSRRSSVEVATDLLTKLGLWSKYFTEENTFFVEHSFEKQAVAERLNITDYIDDQPSALLGAMKAVPNLYFFDQYNLLEDSNDFIRVVSWTDFSNKLGL